MCGEVVPETCFYRVDSLGSVRAITDGQGQVVARFEYEPFGVTVQASGPLAGDEVHRFTGKPEDGAIELYYFNARYYDPLVGRFLGRDPAGEDPAAYAYCLNNPIVLVDLTGMAVGFGDFRLAEARANDYQFGDRNLYYSGKNQPMMRGPDVLVLQQMLVSLGYRIDIDGVFGPQTDWAVRAFQLSRALKVDGIVGSRTREALLLAYSSRTPVIVYRQPSAPWDVDFFRPYWSTDDGVAAGLALICIGNDMAHLSFGEAELYAEARWFGVEDGEWHLPGARTGAGVYLFRGEVSAPLGPLEIGMDFGYGYGVSFQIGPVPGSYKWFHISYYDGPGMGVSVGPRR